MVTLVSAFALLCVFNLCVGMDIDEEKENQLNISEICDHTSPLFWAIIDDDDDEYFMSKKFGTNSNKDATGRGNAKAGFRQPYILYSASNVYSRVELSAILSILTNVTCFSLSL